MHEFDDIDNEENLEKWMGLAEAIQYEVRGQNEALRCLAQALLTGEMGFRSPKRPKTFAILLGPTGTGKTAAILAASKHLYGTDAIVRLNMAEYPKREDLARLLGEDRTDCGYLGQELARMDELGGKIVLIDEIEKAHKDIANVFLGMEAAELTFANREKKNLESYHIICTSNLGSADAIEMSNLPYSILQEHIEQEAMAHFKPEVWARFTHRIVYRQLPYDVQEDICRKMVAEELNRLSKRIGAKLVDGDGLFRFLVARGFTEQLGARPMRNAVEFYIRGALTDAILARKRPEKGGTYSVALRGDKLVLVPADCATSNASKTSIASKNGSLAIAV